MLIGVEEELVAEVLDLVLVLHQMVLVVKAVVEQVVVRIILGQLQDWVEEDITMVEKVGQYQLLDLILIGILEIVVLI